MSLAKENLYRDSAITKRISKVCLHCRGVFEIPRCRDFREQCCSSACKRGHRETLKAIDLASRQRECPTCKRVFSPRRWQLDSGVGKYCSHSCYGRSDKHLNALFSGGLEKSVQTRKIMRERGLLSNKKGPEHPLWTGGPSASILRNKHKAPARLKAYRAANPHLVREWVQSRSRRKFGRLPRGTIARLLETQNLQCNICEIALIHGYHVDHIQPLAKGGLHVPENIQLLCPRCNVRKGAKDPVQFLREMGKL